jgi:FtsH-binding integral membrane protein
MVWEGEEMFRAQTQDSAQRQGTLAGQVFGLLGFSFVFTAAGAFLAPRFPSVTPFAGIAGLVILLVLGFVRGLAPTLRLGLFYLFSVLQGFVLSTVLRGYVAAGQGDIVVLAAGVTAGTLAVLGGYGWTTKRELSGLGGYLFIGLIGVLIAGVVNIFVRAPLFSVVVAGATAIVFSGYTAVHFQQLRRNQGEPIGLALAIYLDILNLFWAILRLLSYAQNRR